MWRSGMWYEESKSLTLLRGGMIVFGVFLVTGIVFLLLQRGLESVNRGLNRTYRQETSENTGVTPTFSDTSSHSKVSSPRLAPVSPNVAPVAPVYSPPLNAYPVAPRPYVLVTPPPPMPMPITPPRVPVAYTLFTGDAEREKGRAAVAELRETARSFRRFDTDILRKSLTYLPRKAPVSLTAVSLYPDDPERLQEQVQNEANAQMEARQAINRIAGDAESLATELTLTVHPDRFPEPMREGVGEVSQAFRTYLETVRYAAANPEQRDKLLSLAAKHLSAGEAALRELERMLGTSNPRSEF